MGNLNTVKNYYDEFWKDNNLEKQKSSDLRDYEKEARKFIYDFLINYFGDFKNKKILEIGLGEGHDLIEFAKMGANVTGIDISENSLKKSRKLALKNKLKVKLINMDAHNLKFKKNQFDIVFIISTLMHLDYLKAINECKKVMKKNGVLYLIEPINNNLLIKFYRLFFSEFKDLKPRYLKYTDLVKISKNFNKSYIKVFYLFSFLSLVFRNNSFIYYKLSKNFKLIEENILKIMPSLERNCWLSVSIHLK